MLRIFYECGACCGVFEHAQKSLFFPWAKAHGVRKVISDILMNRVN
ncbi:hypothetical protein J4209_06470 [Candidatus Woesearchaeota archaeon]|nr:hypothetical protein [Candidatus Woesearchaeota archaeon]